MQPQCSSPKPAGANHGAPAIPATSRPKTNPNYLQLRWLNITLGKPIRLGLMNGEEIEGKLAGFDQYTLLVEPKERPAWLVWKHAVAYIQGRAEDRG